jgi:hypothetical protein
MSDSDQVVCRVCHAEVGKDAAWQYPPYTSIDRAFHMGCGGIVLVGGVSLVSYLVIDTWNNGGLVCNGVFALLCLTAVAMFLLMVLGGAETEKQLAGQWLCPACKSKKDKEEEESRAKMNENIGNN